MALRAGAWLLAAGGLGVALALSMSDPSPLDDADPAMQRAGILDVVGSRSPAAAVAAGVPAVGRRAVVFFVRPAQALPLVEGLGTPSGSSVRGAADVAVVVSGTWAAPVAGAGGPPVRVDPTGRLSEAYGMRRPRDGGPPVGYAVVGTDGTVRYRTEDPGVADGLSEVRTIVDAVR